MAVKNILVGSGLRELLAKREFEKAQHFTWDKCVRETLEIFNSV